MQETGGGVCGVAIEWPASIMREASCYTQVGLKMSRWDTYGSKLERMVKFSGTEFWGPTDILVLWLSCRW